MRYVASPRPQQQITVSIDPSPQLGRRRKDEPAREDEASPRRHHLDGHASLGFSARAFYDRHVHLGSPRRARAFPRPNHRLQRVPRDLSNIARRFPPAGFADELTRQIRRQCLATSERLRRRSRIGSHPGSSPPVADGRQRRQRRRFRSGLRTGGRARGIRRRALAPPEEQCEQRDELPARAGQPGGAKATAHARFGGCH
jgi:hypothetical protein